MLERFSSPPVPEVHTPQLMHTLVVLGSTQSANGQNPILDHPTRVSSLAAGLLVIAGLAKKIALFSSNPNGIALMKNYLSEIDVPYSSIITQNMPEKLDEAAQIKKLVRNSMLGDVGIITAHSVDKKIKGSLDQVGLHFHPISPEEEIGSKIAQSAQESRHILTELLKESFLNLIRFQKMLDEVQISRLSLTPSTS